MTGRFDHRRPLPATAIVIALVALVPSCSTTSTHRSALPDGISVAVLQNRSDVATRKLEIAVSNQTEESLEVTGAEFASAQFAQPAGWRKDATTIAPGRTVNLPVALGEPDCDSADPVAEVRLALRLGDAAPITVATRPDDAIDRLAALRAEDCLAAAIEEIATLAVMAPPRVLTIAETSVVEVDIGIAPSGVNGAFSIEKALGTTLFAPADPATGAIVPFRSVGRTIDADGDESVLTLTFVPNRCDAHAVAEDKRGTIFPLRVTIGDGTSGLLSLASPPAVKTALIEYLAGACATE